MGSQRSTVDEVAAHSTHVSPARVEATPEERAALHTNQLVSRTFSTVVQPLASGLGALGSGGIDRRVGGVELRLFRPRFRKGPGSTCFTQGASLGHSLADWCFGRFR